MKDQIIKAGIFGRTIDKKVYSDCKKIKKYLEEKGITVDLRYFNTDSKYKRDYPEETFKLVKDMILRNDIFVFELSLATEGLLYILGRVDNMNKPILLLYKEGVYNFKTTSVILEAAKKESRLLKYEAYNDNNLKGMINKFLAVAVKRISRKHTIRIDGRRNEFIEFCADYYKKSIIDVFRDLIDDGMENDENWQRYCNQEDCRNL